MEPRCGDAPRRSRSAHRSHAAVRAPASTLRRARHAASDPSTTEAVAGGGSVARASGSAFNGQTPAVRTDDRKLVARTRARSRNEQLPHAGGIAQPHRVAPRVPGVEVADHRHRTRVRRPDGEAHAAHAVDRHDAGAEMRRQFEVPPLIEQMQIEFAQQRTEANRDPRSPAPRPASGCASRYGSALSTCPTNRPGGATGASVPSERPPARATTSTCAAPGRNARTMRPAGPFVRTQHGERIANVPFASASATPAVRSVRSMMSFMLCTVVQSAAPGRAVAHRSMSDGWPPHRRFRMPPSRSGTIATDFPHRPHPVREARRDNAARKHCVAPLGKRLQERIATRVRDVRLAGLAPPLHHRGCVIERTDHAGHVAQAGGSWLAVPPSVSPARPRSR